MKRLFEYIEHLFRAYRLSDNDIIVMAQKGYGYNLRLRKWVKEVII